MRILCLTPRLPYPPFGGDRLRAYNIIKNLSIDHELSLVSFIAKPSERDNLSALRSLCREVHVLTMSQPQSVMRVLGNLWRPDPLQALYYRSEAMHQLVARVLAASRFDVAYIHLFRMAAYLEHYPQIYRIVDLTDVISKGVAYSLPFRRWASRWIYQFEKPRIDRYERWVAGSFEEAWLISEAERSAFPAAQSHAHLHVVTNGVNTHCFHPTGQPCDPNSLIFVGKMDVFHNIDAVTHLVRDVLPRVRQSIPECRLNIVGMNAGTGIRRLGRQPGVTVTGFEPDLNDRLNRSAVFVAPLRSVGGVQNKVLEALAAGRPVVTTSLVNRGLGAQPDRDLLIADDAETTVSQIVKLLRDERLRVQLGLAARRFVARKFTWDGVSERIRALEAELTRAKHRSTKAESRAHSRQAATR